MLALENHRLIGKARLGRGNVVHAEPCQRRTDQDERNPDEARILNPQLSAFCRRLWFTTHEAEHPQGDNDRHQKLHDRHTGIAQTGVECQRIALLPFGEEEADIGHRGSEIAATEAAEQCQHQEDEIGGVRILHRIADAKRRDEQGHGRQRSPQSTTENRYHETVENPQGRPRQAGQSSEPEELVGRIVETDQRQFCDHHRPDHPHREGEQQAGDGNPQIALGNFCALVRPEFFIFWLPFLECFGLSMGFLVHRRILNILHFGEFR